MFIFVNKLFFRNNNENAKKCPALAPPYSGTQEILSTRWEFFKNEKLKKISRKVLNRFILGHLRWKENFHLICTLIPVDLLRPSVAAVFSKKAFGARYKKITSVEYFLRAQYFYFGQSES